MNSSMVRMGGIAIFVVIALAIILPFVIGQSTVGRIVSSLLQTALFIFALWATKGFFNSQSYNRADLPIMVVIVAWALSFLVGAIAGTPGGLGAIGSTGGMTGFGVLAIVMLLITLVALIGMLIFALRCLDFGKSGGGLWKAIGILYLIGLILLILLFVLLLIAGLAKSMGLIAVGGILGLIGGLVLLAAIICHGIGLITGAGKMSA